MERAKFDYLVRKLANLFKPTQRRRVKSVSRTVWKIIAAATLASGLISFLVNGTELFTKKIPSATASVARYLLLAKTGRPLLLKRIVERDLALPNACPGNVLIADFDGDGEATDLVIELLSSDEQGHCADNMSYGTAYALMKESASDTIWPEYTLLRLIAQSDIGAFQEGIGYPLTFEQRGKFLIGSIYLTDFPGWVVYGYANGEIHEFGRYRPLGSLTEMEVGDPISQLGDKLILPTELGFVGLEITADGQFRETKLEPRNIVRRNNAALVLEVFSTSPDADSDYVESESAPYSRKVASASFEACGYWVMVNGSPIDIRPESDRSQHCVGELVVSPISTVISMAPCDFNGFQQAHQFPWGQVPLAQDASITCPIEGGSQPSFSFTLKVAKSS